MGFVKVMRHSKTSPAKNTGPRAIEATTSIICKNKNGYNYSFFTKKSIAAYLGNNNQLSINNAHYTNYIVFGNLYLDVLAIIQVTVTDDI